MDRRDTLASLLAIGSTFLPIPSVAQDSAKIRKIGYLSQGLPGKDDEEGLRAILKSVGYEEGKNVTIEWRFSERNADKLPGLAADLVNRNVDLILAFSNEEAAAAKEATRTIPIIMMWALSPVESGLIQSLSHPGGNITGTTYFEPEMLTKAFQLLTDVRPKARRIAVLWNSSYAYNPYATGMKMVENLAAPLGMRIEYFSVAQTEQLAPTLKRIAGSRADALIHLQSPVFYYRIAEVAAMALEKKLPSIATIPTWVDRGGLLAYHPSIAVGMKRIASYIDRILRGAKPAELSVEMPTEYRFHINLKTAAAIGVPIPASVRVLANRVIE